ncbi:MAG: hypothetical protein MI757_22220 [Pirellulales bacterium]|nr:hypothetical protein [Pirellulales bacterium]
MNAQKYIQQIKREARANPAKTALLAIMCCVLVYVCVPLFVGSSKQNDKAVAEFPAENIQKVPQREIATGAAHTSEPTNATWQEIATMIDEDARMASVRNLSSDRDPFAPPPKPEVAQAEEPDQEPVRPPAPRKVHFTPDEAGLVLGSTLLGTSGRIAMINGKPYRAYNPNQQDNRRSAVPFATSLAIPEQHASYFVLVDIKPRRVVLWRLGQRHELKLPGLTLADNSAAKNNHRPNPVIPPSELNP